MEGGWAEGRGHSGLGRGAGGWQRRRTRPRATKGADRAEWEGGFGFSCGIVFLLSMRLRRPKQGRTPRRGGPSLVVCWCFFGGVPEVRSAVLLCQ